jgi:DNA-binding transcriptional ArsR family regulator
VTRSQPTPRADAVFGALADPTRRKLLRAVVDQAPITATQLAAAMPISRQAVAKHLTVLDDAGLVVKRRVGRETRFEARLDQLDAATRWIEQTDAAWRGRLDRLAQLDSARRAHGDVRRAR